MNRRRPLLPFDYQGLDIEPQAVTAPAMPMMQPPPPMQFTPMPTNDGGAFQLAQMGTQRALEHLLNRKKKPASPANALAAWEEGGAL